MKKIVMTIILTLIILWTGVFLIDYYSVFHKYKTPPFAIKNSETSFDDGGSGTYNGLGYAFKIEGNFMPDSNNKLSGVVHSELFVFGIPITNFRRAK